MSWTVSHVSIVGLRVVWLGAVLSDYDWRAIVDARIKAKTKRFASATKSAEEGTPNKFSDVAGWFFFPLLRVSRQQNFRNDRCYKLCLF